MPNATAKRIQSQSSLSTEALLKTEHLVSEILSESRPLRETAQMILRAIGANLGWNFGTFWTLDTSEQFLEPIAVWAAGDVEAPQFLADLRSRRFPQGKGLPGRVWSKGKFEWIKNVAKDRGYLRAAIAAFEGLHTAVAFPVLVQKKVAGVVELLTKEFRVADSLFIEGLETIGLQIGSYMEGRLCEQTVKTNLFLDNVIDQIPNMIFIKDAKDLRFVRVNQAAENLLGYDRRDLIGSNDFDFFPTREAEFFTEKDRAVLNKKKMIDILEEPISTSKGIRILHTKKIPLLDENGNPEYLVGISEDITDKKIAEDEYEKILKLEKDARSKAEETADNLKRERTLREIFVTTLSHDLKNPLTAARVSAELILRRHGTREYEEFLEQLIKDVIDNVDRANQMIQDLLDASRIRAGAKLPLNIRRCDFPAFIKESVKRMATIYGDRFALESPAELWGYWDCSYISRLMENLCSNAAKYGYAGRPILISVRKMEPYMEIEVHNEGNPIRPEDMARLFEPYYRSGTSFNGEKGGWGIGLVLVKGVADAHGGKIEVKSAAQTGTSFIVTLPLDCRSLTTQTHLARG